MIRTLRSLAFLAALSAVVLTTVSFDKAVAIGTAIAVGVRAFARHVVDVLAPAATDDRAPAVRFLQAKAFAQRLVTRERPQITGTWRMCPSI